MRIHNTGNVPWMWPALVSTKGFIGTYITILSPLRDDWTVSSHLRWTTQLNPDGSQDGSFILNPPARMTAAVKIAHLGCMTELIPQAKNGISSPSGSSLPLQKKDHRLQFSQLVYPVLLPPPPPCLSGPYPYTDASCPMLYRLLSCAVPSMPRCPCPCLPLSHRPPTENNPWLCGIPSGHQHCTVFSLSLLYLFIFFSHLRCILISWLYCCSIAGNIMSLMSLL